MQVCETQSSYRLNRWVMVYLFLAVSCARPLKNSSVNFPHERPQAVRNIREVRGFGAEARELSRFQGASQGAAAASVKMGAAAGRLEALNRAAINVR